MIKNLKKKIKIGDTVALINPAGPLPERFKNQELYVINYLDTSFEDIEKNLQILDSNSKLSSASAIIFSSIYDRNNPIPNLEQKIKIHKFLTNIQQKYQIDNLLYGFPLGHCVYKLTIPIGEEAQLSCLNGNIILDKTPFTEKEHSILPILNHTKGR